MQYACLHHQEVRRGAYSLVPIRYQDRFDIMRWRNEQIYHLRQAKPLTEEDQQRYFDTVVAALFDCPQPAQILFSYLFNGQCIGYGGLVHINWTDRYAEVSFIMDTAREEKEFALHWTNYLDMLREVAFGDLGLHKLFTYAFDLRPHLYPVLEAAGFVKEAVLKEHCLFEGKFRDVIIHSLFACEVVNYTALDPARSKEVLALRNLPENRRLMVNKDIIPEESHFSFVESLKTREDRLYYAVFKDGKLLGTYNLSLEGEGVWDRGIIAAPWSRGTGETARWERQIIASLPSQVKALSAKVRLENIRSQRYHLKMGFQEQSRDAEYIYYLLPL